MTETVPDKAARLWRGLSVVIISQGPLYTEAVVTGDHGEYTTVLYADSHWWCSCKWGRTHPYPARPCSHAEALAYILEEVEI